MFNHSTIPVYKDHLFQFFPMYKIRFFLLATFFLISYGAVLAQYPGAKVSDFGSLYSTYGDDDLRTGLSGKFSATKLAFIVENANESAWPDGIATLDRRNENRSKMYDYKLYKVATFGSDSYTLLLVPAAENKHMEPDMQPGHDIYFVVSTNVVSVENGNSTVTETTTKATAAANPDPAVKIADPGQLMSGYDLENDSKGKALLINAGLTEADFKVFSALCKEAAWPDGINSFSDRQGVQELMKQYKTRFAANFIDDDGNDITIVHIPYAENQHMPANMRPDTKDQLYMVLMTKGVSYEGQNENSIIDQGTYEDSDFEYSVFIDETDDFDSQLNFIVESSHNNFDDLISDKIVEKEGTLNFGDRFRSRVCLQEAKECYIATQLLSKDRTFIATFEDYTDKALAEKDYRYLVDYIEGMYFDCCTFISDESTSEDISLTFWLPFDLDDEMHPSLLNALIEVQLAKSFTIDSQFKMTDIWTLVVRVSNEKDD